jgi:hypothetical protein
MKWATSRNVLGEVGELAGPDFLGVVVIVDLVV